MPIQIVRNDITRMKVDAIVNAAKPSLLGGGGVDGAIHRAAGPGLLEECRTLGGCETGQAKITGGYNLPCRFVIHTVGPVWHGGAHGEAEKLASCFRSALVLAQENHCETVAFPLISAGVYGYPKDQALHVAVNSIAAFLMENDRADDMTMYLVVYSRDSVQFAGKISAGLKEYIDDHYVETHPSHRDRRRQERESVSMPPAEIKDMESCLGAALYDSVSEPKSEENRPIFHRPKASAQTPAAGPLDQRLKTLDESFQQMLLRKIDEKGMTDAQCYKKANVDRKLFSKIRGDVHYSPSKKTAIAFAIALELDLAETRELLMKAGYALSPSNMFDVIVEYFISLRHYNIFEINEALFAYDQITLG